MLWCEKPLVYPNVCLFKSIHSVLIKQLNREISWFNDSFSSAESWIWVLLAINWGAAVLCSYLLQTISCLWAPAAGCRVWLSPDCHRHQFWAQNSHSDTCYQSTPEWKAAAAPDLSPSASTAVAAAARRGQWWSRAMQQRKEANQWCYSQWSLRTLGVGRGVNVCKIKVAAPCVARPKITAD